MSRQAWLPEFDVLEKAGGDVSERIELPTGEELDALEDLHKAATAPPWKADIDYDGPEDKVGMWTGKWYCGQDYGTSGTTWATYLDDDPTYMANVAVMTAARNALPGLIEAARECLLQRAAQPMLDGWRDALERQRDEARRECEKLQADLNAARALAAAAGAEVLNLKREIARRDTCHVCGDCLMTPEDGRCVTHTHYERGDVDERLNGDECGCLYCTSVDP